MAAFLNDPTFPSDGTIPSQWSMWQPRMGVAWDVKGDGKSLVRASWGVYYARQNMLSQVGSVTTNGLQQQTIFANTQNLLDFGAPTPTWPEHRHARRRCPTVSSRSSAASASSIATTRTRTSSPSTSPTSSSSRRTGPATSTSSGTKASDLTRFLNYNRSDPVCCVEGPGTGNVYVYTGQPWGPQLDEVMVTNSLGESRYRGLTLGVRKRLSNGFQLEGNYVLAKDEDDDSNERDPFTDRSFNFFDLSKDWGPSNRDIRHKVNFFSYFVIPHGFWANTRVQYRGPQPITANPRSLNGVDRGRNGERKDNEYFSFDWRLGAAVPVRRALRADADPGDVQHVQQRQQHQPAEHAAALQLRRLPPHRRRRSAAGAAGGEDDVLRRGLKAQGSGLREPSRARSKICGLSRSGLEP